MKPRFDCGHCDEPSEKLNSATPTCPQCGHYLCPCCGPTDCPEGAQNEAS